MNTGKPDVVPDDAAAEPKTCPVCGATFGCMAARKSCWCADVILSAEAAADLREKFRGCLCPRCLALAADRGYVQKQ